ncbi:MAG: acylphosphatase [Saprospirales bacterium]|jgi:acylphosphatase|nr:acylphosphatase [Saprospirales bacterium]
MNRKHINIFIEGKVQGVWFRASTRRKALELGIKGLVKNLPDGRVYVEAEGTDEQLNSFTSWCKQGPELARVDRIEISEGPLKNFHDFDIVR